MKTYMLVLVVVMLHCVMIGSLFFIQGCGTVSPTTTVAAPPPPVRPPPEAVKPLPVQPVKTARHSTPPATPVLPPDTGEYIVQKGDSLSEIAAKAGVKTAELIAANNITDPNRILVGQKLMIPGKSVAPHAPQKPAAPPASAGAASHVVEPGDNLTKIASRYGTTVGAIRAANNLHDDKLLVGQKLAIPAPAAKPEPATAIPAPEPAPEVPDFQPPPLPDEFIQTPEPEPAEAPSADSGQKDDIIWLTHVVQPQETLLTIAKMYSCSVEELAEWNNLSQDAALSPGQRIKIQIKPR